MNRKLYIPAALLLGSAGQAFAGTAGPMPEDLSLSGMYTKPGFEFCTKDKANCLQIGGRLMVDYTYFTKQATNGLNHGADLRQARIKFQGTLAKVWDYKIQAELATGNVVQDAYVRYTGMDSMFVTVGNFRPDFSSQESQGLQNSNFMEFSQAVQAFAPGRRVALQGNFYNNWMTAAVGVFGTDYTGAIGTITPGGRMPIGLNGRLMFTPWNEPGKVASVGGAVLRQSYHSSTSNIVNNATNPGLRQYQGVNLIGGNVSAVDYVTGATLEGNMIYGPFDAEAAYVWNNVNRTGGAAKVKYTGYYVQGGYFVTGESRTWDAKTSTFSGKTSNNTDNGAVQLVARYDAVDMNHAATSTNNGEQKNFTLGVNYYPTDVVKVSANYVHGKYKTTSGGATNKVDMFGVRVQALV